MINKIPTWYPVIAGVLATTVAFGMSFEKINNLEQAMIEQVEQDQKVEKIMIQQSAMDARQEMIIDILKTIQDDIKGMSNE
jgi:hypothetical protein